MWLLVLLLIVVVIGAYILYSRNKAKAQFSEDQIRQIKVLVEDKIRQIRREKQEVINEAAKKGKTIPLAPLLESLEKLKEENKEDEQYIAEIEHKIGELKEKYDANIPVDEAYQLVTDYEDEFGPV